MQAQWNARIERHTVARIVAGAGAQKEIGGTERIGRNRLVNERAFDRSRISGKRKAGGDVGEMPLGLTASAEECALHKLLDPCVERIEGERDADGCNGHQGDRDAAVLDDPTSEPFDQCKQRENNGGERRENERAANHKRDLEDALSHDGVRNSKGRARVQNRPSPYQGIGRCKPIGRRPVPSPVRRVAEER